MFYSSIRAIILARFFALVKIIKVAENKFIQRRNFVLGNFSGDWTLYLAGFMSVIFGKENRIDNQAWRFVQKHLWFGNCSLRILLFVRWRQVALRSRIQSSSIFTTIKLSAKWFSLNPLVIFASLLQSVLNFCIMLTDIHSWMRWSTLQHSDLYECQTPDIIRVRLSCNEVQRSTGCWYSNKRHIKQYK